MGGPAACQGHCRAGVPARSSPSGVWRTRAGRDARFSVWRNGLEGLAGLRCKGARLWATNNRETVHSVELVYTSQGLHQQQLTGLHVPSGAPMSLSIWSSMYSP